MASREEILKNLMKEKPKLLKNMMDCPEPRKLMSLLKDNGIEITETEASKIMRALNFYDITSDLKEEKSSEPIRKLSDNDLEHTSGGLVGEAMFCWEVYKELKSILSEVKAEKEEMNQQQ